MRDIGCVLYVSWYILCILYIAVYVIVTENEVCTGILSVDDIDDKVLCFERNLIDINLKDAVAGKLFFCQTCS